MLSLPNIALRHGKVVGSKRVLYPLNNDPIVQNRLYWTEEFDEEFLQASGKTKNKHTNNMITSPKLQPFTLGAPLSQPYANAGGPTDYSQYGVVFNDTLKTLAGLFGKGGNQQSTAPTYTPPAYTPPPPPPEKGWSTGAIIGVSVAGAAVLGLGIWAIVRATRG